MTPNSNQENIGPTTISNINMVFKTSFLFTILILILWGNSIKAIIWLWKKCKYVSTMSGNQGLLNYDHCLQWKLLFKEEKHYKRGLGGSGAQIISVILD